MCTAQSVMLSESKSETEWPASAIKADEWAMVPMKPFAIAKIRLANKPSQVTLKACFSVRSAASIC